MRAQPYFERESGAGFSVGVGCPSFGGQRTVGSGSIRLHASLATSLKRSLPAKQGRPGTASNSQTEASSRVAVLGDDSCIVTVTALGRPIGENLPLPSWPSLQHICLKSPRSSANSGWQKFRRSRRWRFFVRVIALLRRVGLTPPSRGRPASGPPLTSNVRAQ
jgi:hypothetical protein